MFSGHKVSNGILYLYVDLNYEIAVFNSKENKKSIISSVKKYIKEHKIKYDGAKVVLLLSGLVIGSVYLNNDMKKDDYNAYPSSKYVSNIINNDIPNNLIINTIPSVSTQVSSNENNNYVKEEKANTEVKKETVSNSKKEVVISNEIKEQSNNVIKEDNNKEIIVTNEEKQDELVTDKLIKVQRKDGSILSISINDYLIGVVAAEMPASFNKEALKAQSVVARTYTLKLIKSNRSLTDDVSTQVYKDNEELKQLWGNNYESYYNKIKGAVFDTNDEVIKYNGELIDAVYHSTSNGYTEDSYYVWNNKVDYLKSVPSAWDTSAPTFLRSTSFTYDDIKNALGIDIDENSVIEVISRNESNRITLIKINDKKYTGVELRKLLNLRSADFDIENIDGGIKITTRGYGHGVGMSQYGANNMAQSGYNYKQILNYYYSNINIVSETY